MLYKRAHISTAVVSSVEFIINLNVWSIIQIIIKKYGMTYLLKYIFLLSML
jgi:hypothetical protein